MPYHSIAVKCSFCHISNHVYYLHKVVAHDRMFMSSLIGYMDLLWHLLNYLKYLFDDHDEDHISQFEECHTAYYYTVTAMYCCQINSFGVVSPLLLMTTFQMICQSIGVYLLIM